MKKSGEIRIIGGKWKRRKIRFPDLPDLRPSPDMVRESLFNWLMGKVEQSVCLDLYAGSGAIGFEAASRGARHVVMVESNKKAYENLLQNQKNLNAESTVMIEQKNVMSYLESGNTKFDIVFMDPPFDSNVIGNCCESLVKFERLSTSALIYIESPVLKLPLPIPPSWNIIRESSRGKVHSTLLESGKTTDD